MYPAPFAVGIDVWREDSHDIEGCTDGHVELGVEVKTLLIDVPDLNLFWNPTKPEGCGRGKRNLMAGQGACDVSRATFCATLLHPLLGVIPVAQCRENRSYQVAHVRLNARELARLWGLSCEGGNEARVLPDSVRKDRVPPFQ